MRSKYVCPIYVAVSPTRHIFPPANPNWSGGKDQFLLLRLFRRERGVELHSVYFAGDGMLRRVLTW